MNPNTVTLSNIDAGIITVAFSVLAITTVCLWVFYSNEKRRRLFEREMHQRRLVQLERCVEFYNERDRLAEAVSRQRADAPAVTLPVTHCERRERRRRFLPLEGDTDGAG